MMQGRPSTPVRGRKPVSEIPTPQELEQLRTGGGDAAYQGFVNQYGFDALDPNRMNPNRVPLPRPREPDLDYNNPLGPLAQEVPPGVGMKTSDVSRAVQGENLDYAPGYGGVASEAPGQEPSQEPSDEELLDKVRQGMTGMGGDTPKAPPGSGLRWENIDDDRRAVEENPTPENAKAFADYWDPEELGPNGQDAYFEDVDRSQR